MKRKQRRRKSQVKAAWIHFVTQTWTQTGSIYDLWQEPIWEWAKYGCQAAAWASSIIVLTLDTAHSTLPIAHCTLQTAHCTLHTAHCTLHTAHCTLHTAYCTLHTSQSILPTAHFFHCTLPTAIYNLHTAHCTLHTNLFIYQARESSLVPPGFLIAQFLQKT